MPKLWTRLVHKNSWDNLLHLRVVDSTLLEPAKSLIVRAFYNCRVAVHINNSL